MNPGEIAGRRVGIYIGIGPSEYGGLIDSAAGTPDGYAVTGVATSFSAGRLSYMLGLQGPSLAVDTACSSSLVAVHLGCQSLRVAECEMALVGGVHLMLSPEPFIYLSRMRALSPDGRCKTFSAEADGYGRGEGCGVLVLKRLSDALASGDRIFALIRGSAVNHDGRSSGLTVPNGLAQQEVIREALENARLRPGEVDYVEAHGTGTSLGDPLEVEALATVYGQGRDADRPLMVSSVKTNIGHLESAAGVAGVLKVVLALEHDMLPPHLHAERLNPHLEWSSLPIMVTKAAVPWPAGGRPRRAGVSAFGLSGTNAHLILEEAPRHQKAAAEVERPLHVLPLSAKTPLALREQVGQYLSWLERQPEQIFPDVCHTAATGRSHFEERVAVVASSGAEARMKLGALVAQGRFEAPNGSVPMTPRPKLAMLFAGEGAQYAGMGSNLYETQPVFREAFQQCEEFSKLPNHSLRDALDPEAGQSMLREPEAYQQSALFALEFALHSLWRSWGIVPDAVMGVGVGEFVSACLSGVFTLEDALKLVAERARLMQSLVDDSETFLVRATADSGVVMPALDEFKRLITGVELRSPKLAFVSSLTGNLETEQVATADYWSRQLPGPLSLEAGMKMLASRGSNIFLEVGPQATLIDLGRTYLPAGRTVWLPSLRKGHEAWSVLLDSFAQLYTNGVEVDWAGFDRPYAHRRRITLPSYPFQRQRYWPSGPAKSENGHSPVNSAHPFLAGASRTRRGKDVLINLSLNASLFPYLAEHRVFGTEVLPATVYMEIARAAAVATFDRENWSLENLQFKEPFFLEEAGTIDLVLSDLEGGISQFSFSGRVKVGAAKELRTYAVGKLRAIEQGHQVAKKSTRSRGKNGRQSETTAGY